MDNMWIKRAQQRLDENDYLRKKKFLHAVLQIIRNRNGDQVLMTRTDSGRKTHVCVVCFVQDGKIFVACGKRSGLPNMSCCFKHREKEHEGPPIGIITEDTAPKNDECHDEIAANVAKFNSLISDDIKIEINRMIIQRGFKHFMIFHDEPPGETKVNKHGQPYHIFPSGHIQPVCPACVCLLETVRAVSSESGILCGMHHRSEVDWNIKHKHKEMIISTVPPKSRVFLAFSWVEKDALVPTRASLKALSFKYKMKLDVLCKIARRLHNGENPVVSAGISPSHCPYIDINGEFRMWDGHGSFRICEACYAKQNTMRLTRGGLARLCVDHLDEQFLSKQ